MTKDTANRHSGLLPGARLFHIRSSSREPVSWARRLTICESPVRGRSPNERRLRWKNGQWPTYLDLAEQGQGLPQGSRKLPGTSWLLPLPAGLTFLGRLAYEQEKSKFPISYAVVFLSEEPNFHSPS